jgi:hypothetical protein
MLTKRTLIIKILYILLVILPYILIIGSFIFSQKQIIVFFVFYFLINIIIFIIKRNIKWIKYIIYILDALIVFLAVIYTIYFISICAGNPESSFAVFEFIIIGKIIFFGLMGLFLTYCDNKFVGHAWVTTKDFNLTGSVMLTKRTVIIKTIYLMLVMFFYILLFVSIIFDYYDFKLYILGCCFFGGAYWLINIIACLIKRNIKWIRYILYILDSFIVLSAIIYTIRLIILEGKASFTYIYHPMMGVFIFFGLMGLFFTYHDTKRGVSVAEGTPG